MTNEKIQHEIRHAGGYEDAHCAAMKAIQRAQGTGRDVTDAAFDAAIAAYPASEEIACEAAQRALDVFALYTDDDERRGR